MSFDVEARRDRRQGLGFLALLRKLERQARNLPRIGQSARVREDIVELGQDPYLGFPDSDLSDADLTRTPPRVRPRFLGFFGPFGPLPSAITREADSWARNGDPSFVRFTDILAARFIQLFFRSWSDARPITQFDHESGGTFPDMLRAFTGDAGAAFRDRGAIDDVVRLRYTALQTGRVKSPTRLRETLHAHFGVDVRIEEFASSWLDFAPEDRSRLGRAGMALGQSFKLGKRTPTTTERIVLHITCHSAEAYKSFLPGRPRHAELCDLVMGYLGHFHAVEVALWLDRDLIVPAVIGRTVELGWMAAIPQSAAMTPATDAALKLICRYQVAHPGH